MENVEGPYRVTIADLVYPVSVAIIAFLLAVLILVLLKFNPQSLATVLGTSVLTVILYVVIGSQGMTRQVVFLPPILGLVYESVLPWMSARKASWGISVCLSLAALLIPVAGWLFFPPSIKWTVPFSAFVLLPFAGLYRFDGT